MEQRDQNLIFIVGVGAPANLYSDYLEDLKKRLPQKNLKVIEWWNQADFGITALDASIENADAILVCHSGGGTLGLQAIAKWPNNIKKIIMLDSQFLHKRPPLLTVSQILDVMLSQDDSTIKNKVKAAYAPIIDDDLIFNKSLNFAIAWVNKQFDSACLKLNTMAAHTALFMGFTNSGYQALSGEEKNTLLAFWKRFGVDVKFLPINHFDLIDKKHAVTINQMIVSWLNKS